MLSSNSIELREWSIKIPIIITLSFDMTLPHFRQTTTKVKELESWENNFDRGNPLRIFVLFLLVSCIILLGRYLSIAQTEERL